MTKTIQTTTAQNIADIFDNDGSFREVNGKTIGDHCDEQSAKYNDDLKSQTVRYAFADGSSIVIAESGWDFGHDGMTCHCWVGAGHWQNCPEDHRASLDDNDISSLCTEAADAGDEDQAELCERALAGDDAARSECLDVMVEAWQAGL